MIKKLMMLILILSLCACALGEGLPDEAIALWEQRWPDYTPRVWYGWADKEAGQLLAALEYQGDYILSMAEKKPQGPWQITLEAPNALRDQTPPDLFLDTDGDTLLFSYWEEDTKIQYHSTRAPSGGREWGTVSAVVYGAQEERLISASEGQWHWERCLIDENGNILEKKVYPPVHKGEAWEQGLKLETCDINALPLQPEGWQ